MPSHPVKLTSVSCPEPGAPGSGSGDSQQAARRSPGSRESLSPILASSAGGNIGRLAGLHLTCSRTQLLPAEEPVDVVRLVRPQLVDQLAAVLRVGLVPAGEVALHDFLDRNFLSLPVWFWVICTLRRPGGRGRDPKVASQGGIFRGGVGHRSAVVHPCLLLCG